MHYTDYPCYVIILDCFVCVYFVTMYEFLLFNPYPLNFVNQVEGWWGFSLFDRNLVCH